MRDRETTRYSSRMGSEDQGRVEVGRSSATQARQRKNALKGSRPTTVTDTIATLIGLPSPTATVRAAAAIQTVGTAMPRLSAASTPRYASLPHRSARCAIDLRVGRE